MHFLATISDHPEVCFRLRLLIQTLNLFGDYKLTVVVTGDEQSWQWEQDRMAFRDVRFLEQFREKQPFICEHAEILRCPYSYETHPPCRWFVPPQDDLCVFIDADILCCNPYEAMRELGLDHVRGVPAYRQVLSAEDWLKLGDGLYADTYFNYGVMYVPAHFQQAVGRELFRILPTLKGQVLPEHLFYLGQISLACALRNSGTPCASLPFRYNYFSCFTPEEINRNKEEYDQCVFYHYFAQKVLIQDIVGVAKISSDGQLQMEKLVSSLQLVCPQIKVL